MSQDSIRLIAHIVNASVLILVILGVFIFIKKIKFSDKNNKLLFVLYMLYWISPLLCRDYTACMHVHMHVGDQGMLLWIPIMSYGIITLLWRPLNDIFTYRLKSRKTVIFLSLAVQLFCLVPFLVYPCFATNVVQSIGAGVGAAGIGLFNLMFNEKETHTKKKFLTVSLFAVPPILSGIIVSPLETMIASAVPTIHTSYMYVGTIWVIFFVGLASIIACIILTSFVHEKKEMLYQHDKYKRPIQSKSEIWSFVMICICGVAAFAIKWATAGETSTLQLSYIGINDGTFKADTSMFEGYLGLWYSIGALIGTICSGIWLNRTKNLSRTQMLLIGLSSITSIVYLAIVSSWTNTYLFFFMSVVNGLSYGLMWNVLIGIALSKVFSKTNKVTPIGIFNASISLGMILGSFLVGYYKAPVFDLHGGWGTYTFADFKLANRFVNAILMGFALLMMICYVIAYFLYEKGSKSERIKISKQFVTQSDSEL